MKTRLRRGRVALREILVPLLERHGAEIGIKPHTLQGDKWNEELIREKLQEIFDRNRSDIGILAKPRINHLTNRSILTQPLDDVMLRRIFSAIKDAGFYNGSYEAALNAMLRQHPDAGVNALTHDQDILTAYNESMRNNKLKKEK